MSARAIRRSFAAPFILTVATMSPAIADDKAPAKPKEPDKVNPPPPQPPSKNPPAPDTVRPPVKNPPPPQKPEPAKFERHWSVMKDTAKGAKPNDCIAMAEGTCPKVEPGKPIPPC